MEQDQAQQFQRGSFALTRCHHQAPCLSGIREGSPQGATQLQEEYLKAKEDYDLAMKKHALINQRLKKGVRSSAIRR